MIDYKKIFLLLVVLAISFVQSGCYKDLYDIETKKVLSREIALRPYLQAVTENSAYVMVESDSRDSVFVEYGNSEELGNYSKTSSIVATTADPATYVHRVKLKNLTPGNNYFYKVFNKGKESGIFSFKTNALPGAAFIVGILGDTRSNPVIHAEAATKLKAFRPDFSLYLGDLCNEGSYESWKKEFMLDEQLALAAEAPFYNAVGNHEGWDKNTKAFTLSPGPVNKPYYSFDYGDAHFLILSTEHSVSPGSTQYEFAKKDLENNERIWTVVVFHKSAYAFGGHGHHSSMAQVSDDLFIGNNIDVVLTGHSHFYQRNLVRGIHHITAAGGGAPLKSPVDNPDYTIKSSRQHHFAVAEVSSVRFDLTVYSLDGHVIDKLVLEK